MSACRFNCSAAFIQFLRKIYDSRKMAANFERWGLGNWRIIVQPVVKLDQLILLQNV